MEFEYNNIITNYPIQKVAEKARNILCDLNSLSLACREVVEGCYKKLVKEISENKIDLIFKNFTNETCDFISKVEKNNLELEEACKKLFVSLARFQDCMVSFPKATPKDEGLNKKILSCPKSKFNGCLTVMVDNIAHKTTGIKNDLNTLPYYWQDDNGQIFKKQVKEYAEFCFDITDRYVTTFKNIYKGNTSLIDENNKSANTNSNTAEKTKETSAKENSVKETNAKETCVKEINIKETNSMQK